MKPIIISNCILNNCKINPCPAACPSVSMLKSLDRVDCILTKASTNRSSRPTSEKERRAMTAAKLSRQQLPFLCTGNPLKTNPRALNLFYQRHAFIKPPPPVDYHNCICHMIAFFFKACLLTDVQFVSVQLILLPFCNVNVKCIHYFSDVSFYMVTTKGTCIKVGGERTSTHLFTY